MPEKPKPFKPYPAAAQRRPRERRESACKRGYDRSWQKASKAYLDAHPLCAECESQGRLTSATLVDHIIPHKGDMATFWMEGNWQGLCASCHNSKTARENRP